MSILLKQNEVCHEIDPLVESLTEDQLDNDILEYRALLDSNVPEERIHNFLSHHTYFFNGVIRLFGSCPVYSKVKLGHNYEVDFAWFDSGSFGPEWRITEIEAPKRTLFTKSGQPSAWLTHAIQQVRDWHSWVHENLDFARKLMPGIEYPIGYVFIGCRNELSSDIKKKLRRLSYEQRMYLRIHTLDWFWSAAESVRNIISKNKGGNWPLPMLAKSHSNLADGLPESATKHINSLFVTDNIERLVKFRLEEREFKGLEQNEFIE